MTSPTVIFEDNHLLVLNKPAGWLVQADRTGDVTLTDWGKDYLKEKYNKPGAVFLHPVHRIDRPVSGAVIFARTDKALGRLTTMFRDKKVQKYYLALVVKKPPQPAGMLRHFLLKDEARNVVQAFSKPYQDAKESVTEYCVVETGCGLSPSDGETGRSLPKSETGRSLPKSETGRSLSLRVIPHTGRPHQIRVQLAEIGCPILGDLKYGAPKALPDASIALHYERMELIHPVRQEPLVVIAPKPDVDWWR